MKQPKFNFRPFIGPLVVLFGIWGTYFVTIFARIITVTSDGIVVGHENVWSDWALHIGLARIFATKAPSDWFAYHPVFAGGKLTYPFLTNLISGLLMRGGVSLPMAFIWPSIIFALLMLGGMYALLYVVTRSRWLPVGIMSLFFLNAGLGWWHWLLDVIYNPSWSMIAYPPDQYSRFGIYQWYSGSVITGMFVPQRAFLIGMMLAVWVMTIVFSVLRKTEWTKVDRILLLVAGVLAGILPIAHMHSFIATVLVTGLACLVFRRYWRLLLWFVVPAGVISGALYLIFLRGGIDNPNFFSWYPFWGAHRLVDWLVQWWWQWGLLLPVTLISGYALRHKLDTVQKIWIGSLAVLFVWAQFMLFQPVQWDNSKLFLWAGFGFCTLVGLGLQAFWRLNIWTKVVTIVVIFCLIMTGVLELIQLQRIDKHHFTLITTEEMQLGDALQQLTGPRDVFLTAPVHNHPVMVWGARSIVMGYSAWAWNFGFDYAPRENDMKTLYRATSDITPLLQKYHIDYVVFGLKEEQIDGLNEDYYRTRYPLLYQTEHYRVYDVRSVVSPH